MEWPASDTVHESRQENHSVPRSGWVPILSSVWAGVVKGRRGVSATVMLSDRCNLASSLGRWPSGLQQESTGGLSWTGTWKARKVVRLSTEMSGGQERTPAQV